MRKKEKNQWEDTKNRDCDAKEFISWKIVITSISN